MFNKNGKKRRMPYLAAGVGALAAFGAYSIFKSMRECCRGKIEKMKNAVKKKNDSSCEDGCYTDGECGECDS